MNAKQVKRLRKEMKKRNKFTLSVKDGYVPDLRVGSQRERTVYYNPLTKTLHNNVSDDLIGICQSMKTTRTTVVNVAKTQYKQLKKALRKALKG
jgi:hypothetical protein